MRLFIKTYLSFFSENSKTMSNKKIFWTSWWLVITLLATGFAALGFGFVDYGVVLFCMLPVSVGLAAGMLPNKKPAIFGMLLALGISVAFLWLVGMEGLVCIVMALPIIGLGILAGWLIIRIVKHLTKKDDTMQFSLIPYFLFLSAIVVDNVWNGNTEHESVTTTITISQPSNIVYDHIKNVDTVTSSANFLHHLGLPYPRKCTLTEEAIGGLRICKFDEGDIVETITAIKKNELLEMDVTSYNMPGQRWLSFEKDIYRLSGKDDSTTISRTTTYRSVLKPRLYWKWMEKWTIEAEQDLVFKNLSNELAGK